MKIILFVLIFISGIFQSYSQFQNSDFKYFFPESDDFFTLYFDNKNQYILSVVYQTGIEWQAEDYLSFGKYRQKGNMIYLLDSYHGYEFNFEIKDKSLIARQIYGPLMDKRFEYYGKNDFPLEPIYGLPPAKENGSEKKVKLPSFKLRFGTYGTKYYNINHYLVLNNAYTFTYQLNYLPLLKGTFKRVGNELHLFDPKLNFTFKFKIQKDGIVENFISMGELLKFLW
jgi:hypothetical protein